MMKKFNPLIDSEDEFQPMRDAFEFPNNTYVYFNGNSLGPQPKKTQENILKELSRWKMHLTHAHHGTTTPWVNYHQSLCQRMANFLGTQTQQLMLMNALTVNLHLALISFYQPTIKRYKIIYVKGFSSDIYALESHVQQRWSCLKNFLGHAPFDLQKALIPIEYDENYYISSDKIASRLEEFGHETVLLMFEAVHYQTGQLLDIKKISELAAKYDVLVGVDLAHMVGNIPLHLNSLNIDFAVWCNYKYMNAGPGAIGGFYVNEKHLKQLDLIKLHGWWGVPNKQRFLMSEKFIEDTTAAAWAISNPNIFSLAILEASLDIFEKIDMSRCYQKSLRLGNYCLELLHENLDKEVKVVTSNPRGCQLSLLFPHHVPVNTIEKALNQKYIYCDSRPPLLRIAPNGLYNTFEDVYSFVKILKSILSKLASNVGK
jgi:kynureninase